MEWLAGTVGRRVPHRPLCFAWATLGLLLGLAPVAAALAQATGGAGNGIYSCTDARGRRLTSDRPIIECLDREQRVMNNDGSTRATLPPSMTANERAAVEEAQRQKQAEETARKDTIRHDRNLMARFPNEAAHNKAREAALDNLRDALKLSEKRLAELEQDERGKQRGQVAVHDGEKGRIEAADDGVDGLLPFAKLIADALVDDDVGVHGHAQGQQHAADARKGEGARARHQQGHDAQHVQQ